MTIFNNTDDDQERDYFNEIPEEEPGQKEPVYTEDDPRYWDSDDKWDHLKPRRRTRWYLYLAAAVVALALVVALWLRFFNPYVSDAVQYGYIHSIEKRGLVFKTDEGVLLPYKSLMDTTRAYGHDFIFSAGSARVSADLRRFEAQHRPVRVTYSQYNATVPWRGASKIVITKVDSVDPSKIMPPGWERLKH